MTERWQGAHDLMRRGGRDEFDVECTHIVVPVSTVVVVDVDVSLILDDVESSPTRHWTSNVITIFGATFAFQFVVIIPQERNNVGTGNGIIIQRIPFELSFLAIGRYDRITPK